MHTKRLDVWQLYLSRSIAALVSVCALSVFLYVVFLMLAVQHTAARTSAQREVDALTVHLSGLETQYLAKTKELTPARAAELGFVQPHLVSAVFADTNARTLSFRQ
jgi:hypothetical protein